MIASGALAGAASGAIMTGTLKGATQGALWGGITAGVSFGVAEGVSAMTGINAHSASFFNGVNKASITKAIAHGLSRTALSELRYGTTKGAFMSGFISSGFSVGADAEYGAIKMAIIGGTVSELGGGKFANGAMGSAFQYMFNDKLSSALGAGTKMGTKKFGEELNINRPFVNIVSDGAKGAVIGAWRGAQVGGAPIAFAGGVFGLANGLTAGEILESSGFNSYVDNTITKTTNILNNSFQNIPSPQPVCNTSNQCIMP